jgi:hypothetical protein
MIEFFKIFIPSFPIVNVGHFPIVPESQKAITMQDQDCKLALTVQITIQINHANTIKKKKNTNNSNSAPMNKNNGGSIS